MSYYSSGKILLTGEYLVLKGAKALALPTKKGQFLAVEDHYENKHLWEAYDVNGQLWLEISFSLDLKNIDFSNDLRKAQKLQQILLEIKKNKPELFLVPKKFKTYLEFNREWGLGSSSTLINNLSLWAKIDAFDLLDKTFGGSGYDLAVAQEKRALIYKLQDQKPFWQITNFEIPFGDDLFFVYLNRKQNSRDAIREFNKLKISTKVIQEISDITQAIQQAKTLDAFSKLLEKHEKILSRLLKRPTIKETLFPDYPGTIKSLGAWGGDFILATSKEAPEYFQKKSYIHIVKYKDFIL